MPNRRARRGIIRGVPGARMRWLVVALVVAGASVLAALAGLSSAAASSGDGLPARSCPRPTIPVPAGEPVYRAGPTGLVSGLYIQGGPVPPPPCHPEPRGPYAGTITVFNPQTGATVARRSVASGHLAHILLTPGVYRVTGRLQGGGRA